MKNKVDWRILIKLHDAILEFGFENLTGLKGVIIFSHRVKISGPSDHSENTKALHRKTWLFLHRYFAVEHKVNL